MKKALLLGLNLFWFLIALSPLIYGREVFAIREPYAFWVAGALALNFAVSHLLILYEPQFKRPQLQMSDWLGRIPLAILGVLVYLCVPAIAWLNLNVFNGISLLLLIALFVPVVFFNAFVLGFLSFSSEDKEKQKRDRLDSVLRDLSDDDLLRLKQRLSDGTIRTEHLESQLIDSDSDLLYRGQG